MAVYVPLWDLTLHRKLHEETLFDDDDWYPNAKRAFSRGMKPNGAKTYAKASSCSNSGSFNGRNSPRLMNLSKIKE